MVPRPIRNLATGNKHLISKDNQDRYFTDYSMLTGGGLSRATMRQLECETSLTELQIRLSTSKRQGSTSCRQNRETSAQIGNDMQSTIRETNDSNVLKALTTKDGEEDIPWSEVANR